MLPTVTIYHRPTTEQSLEGQLFDLLKEVARKRPLHPRFLYLDCEQEVPDAVKPYLVRWYGPRTGMRHNSQPQMEFQ